jgi:hypothetical protein
MPSSYLIYARKLGASGGFLSVISAGCHSVTRTFRGVPRIHLVFPSRLKGLLAIYILRDILEAPQPVTRRAEDFDNDFTELD